MGEDRRDLERRFIDLEINSYLSFHPFTIHHLRLPKHVPQPECNCLDCFGPVFGSGRLQLQTMDSL